MTEEVGKGELDGTIGDEEELNGISSTSSCLQRAQALHLRWARADALCSGVKLGWSLGW